MIQMYLFTTLFTQHVGSFLDYTDPCRSGDRNRTVKYVLCVQVHFNSAFREAVTECSTRQQNHSCSELFAQVVHSRELVVRKVSGSNNARVFNIVKLTMFSALKLPSGAVYMFSRDALNSGISYIEKNQINPLLLSSCLLPCDQCCEHEHFPPILLFSKQYTNHFRHRFSISRSVKRAPK